MIKFNVTRNPNDAPFSSSSIIVDGFNNAAKKLGLYDEEGINVHYSHLCEEHGKKRHTFISLYELNFPELILNNAHNKPIIGSSRDNMFFIINGGYPSNLSSYVNFGIDSNVWRFDSKRLMKDKFVFLSYCDSNTRSGFLHLITAFGHVFKGNKDVVLYLKDRFATPIFEKYVQEAALQYEVNIIHDNKNIENWQDQIDIYASADCHFFVNHSSTHALTVLQGLAAGCPTACMMYSGPRDYCSEQNILPIKYQLRTPSPQYLQDLVNFGLRNYLFTSGYKSYPTWAEPDFEDLKEKLIIMKDDRILREKCRENGRRIAESWSWEKAAVNLSIELSRWF